MEIQYWVEVSGCLEYYFKKHNGITISNSFAPDILGIDSSCIVLEDNDECHYERAFGPNGEIFRKMIFGLSGIDDFKEVIAEVDNYCSFITNVDETTKIKKAIYIIENTYRAHEEDGFNELTQAWHQALVDSVNILKTKYPKTETVDDYLEYGEYLLSDMHVLELHELSNLKLHSNKSLFEEVARINIKENEFFSFNEYEIKIQSHDHNPPHLHIKSDGWNIAYEIETGKEIEIIERGEQRNVYEYITKNVVKWLDNKCALIPQITNRENAMAQWIQLHG